MAVLAFGGGTIKKLKSNISGSAAIFTWIFLLNLSQVYGEGQRCYVCGPRSYQWYSNGPPATCNDFKPDLQFEVLCGKGYDYCAIIKTPGSQELSRVCIETYEPRGCISKACAKTKTLFTVCSCNGTLCNGEISSTTETSETSTQSLTTSVEKDSHEIGTTTIKAEIETTPPTASKTTQKAEDNKSHETAEVSADDKIESKSEEHNEEHAAKSEEHTTKPNVEIPPTEIPLKHEHENSVQIDEVKMNKTKESKMERDLANVAGHKQETVTSHSLPSPEALGQEHKKNVKKQGQGAPVDDEEDAIEGSGNRVEVDQKVHNPTTHLSQTQTTTTTTPPKNSAGVTISHVTLISLWTLIALTIAS